MKIDFAREIILKTLYKIDVENSYSNIILDDVLNKNRKRLSDRDISFITEIVYGVTTWRLTLDYIIEKYSKIKIKKISKWILNIMRMGVYQIIFLDKVPKSAAVNESVNLSKKYGIKSSSFVNAILRKIEKSDFEKLNNIINDVERISKITSMPEWIVKELNKEHDIQKTEEICIGCNIKPKICIRVNTLKTNKEELKEKLVERKIAFEEKNLENFIYLNNIKNVTDIDLYKEGFFTLQDEAAGLTSIVLDPKKGEEILDCCSAPGGKTTHLAEIMKNDGSILAWDVHKSRLDLVEENSNRLGIDIINIKEHDASMFKKEYIEKFDRILLDVPCLGLGVIRRKPDIKWQRKEEDIEEINKIQYKILENCSKFLKKGGYMVYSTCSIICSENDKIIQEFLKNNEKEFEIVKKYDNKNEITNFLNNINSKGMIKLYPNNFNDGFFICFLRKK